MGERRNWRIQLRFQSGAIVNATVLATPTHEFTIPAIGTKPEAHFKILMTLLKCGEDIEILRVIYRQVDAL